jgi:5-methylcytosine-specific restriction endonuclease McrA
MHPNDTTKVCRKCGEIKPLSEFHKQRKNPDGLQYWCKDCKRQNTRERGDYFAQYHAEHRERYREQRAQNREQINAQWRERYRTDEEYREQRKQRRRVYSPKYRDRERERHYKRWADPEYRKMRIAQKRERRHHDPEYRRKLLHWRRARQARIQIQGKPFTHAEWIALCKHYNYHCLCCGEIKTLTPDHIVPISRGGSSDINNIQPLCIDCNKRKSARTIDYRPGT